MHLHFIQSSLTCGSTSSELKFCSLFSSVMQGSLQFLGFGFILLALQQCVQSFSNFKRIRLPATEKFLIYQRLIHSSPVLQPGNERSVAIFSKLFPEDSVNDFESLRSKNYYFFDKSHFIYECEKPPLIRCRVLYRPRQMGKFLLLSMLDCYYNIHYKDRYDDLFARFNGHRLRLERFNLTQFLSRISNDPEAFKTLRSLEIEESVGLVHLPSLPNLRELLVARCDDLKCIATMSKLRDLTCVLCKDLESISPDQPRLTTCWVKRCDKLSDIAFANQRMERFGMLHCPCVAAVSMLGQVKSVDIIAWTEAAPFEHICDLSTSVNHIEKLLLDHIERFTTCEGIHHIDHLQIKRCDSLTSTAGLSNIFKVLEIGRCPNLSSLVDVEDIPLIALEGKLNIDINTMKDRFVISCEDKEAINEKVQVFGLIRMREELESDPRWQKLIRSLFKIET